jgi:hypothetical protein
MRIHPNITQLNGVLTIALQAQFVGDQTDTVDEELIAAYGDPQVNLAGPFIDPSDSTFQFSTGAAVVQVGLTQQMFNFPAQFMTSLPPAVPGKPIPSQGPLMVITPNPVRAATIWKNLIVGRINLIMTNLRAQQSPLTSLPDATV